MFIILDDKTQGWTQWRKGHDDTWDTDDCGTDVLVNKAFNTKEDAENFIREKFEDKVDIDVYWPTNPYIDAQVTVYLNIWEDEDGETGGYDTIQHFLRIIELA